MEERREKELRELGRERRRIEREGREEEERRRMMDVDRVGIQATMSGKNLFSGLTSYYYDFPDDVLFFRLV